ncbi:hypothetical protein DM02DRAFT_710166 [Periconia macrospinosa]|uniref:Uncharacterized protein n=1 Tax=Periconia macrospinosa TaxID=97972 RepID=A0A2V1DPH6_9PLEO|nr:hypothetical protein DM02DRAFT_710166 [Periconia macrospinosa]
MAMENFDDVQQNPATIPSPAVASLLDRDLVRPQGWPTTPKAVRSRWLSIISDTVADLTLLACSVLFFAFPLIVHHYDQADIRNHPYVTKVLTRATQVGPSIFPILFAAVLGRAAHSIMLWYLEVGAPIGTLDLLAGSTSLTSTVTSQLQLHAVSLPGLALIAIWALSPIGGQASLRQMSLENQTVPIADSLTYMTHSGSTAQFGYSNRGIYWAIVNALFSATLLAPVTTKLSPRDTWGNLRVPMLEHFESSSSSNEGGWFSIDYTGTEDVHYSSLVGIPISGTNSSFIDYSFSMESQYLQLKCSLVNYTLPFFDSGTEFLNKSGPYLDSSHGQGMDLFWWMNTTERLKTNPNATQEPLNFALRLYWPEGIENISKCNITTTYVEMDVTCPTSTTCAASRIRRSKRQHPPAAFTQLDLQSYAFSVSNWDIFADAFATAFGLAGNRPSMISSYLANPLNPASVEMTTNNLARPTPNDEYMFRLNQLINTYWTSTTGMVALSSGLDTMNTYKGESGLLPTTTSSTRVTKKLVTPVIKAHDGWIAVLSIASGILVMASLIPPFFRLFLRRAPDIMMNMSSLGTRHNSYFPLPDTGSFLDAADRARLLRDCLVRFGDAGGDGGDVGKLVIGALEPPGSTSQDIQRIAGEKRLYK